MISELERRLQELSLSSSVKVSYNNSVGNINKHFSRRKLRRLDWRVRQLLYRKRRCRI